MEYKFETCLGEYRLLAAAHLAGSRGGLPEIRGTILSETKKPRACSVVKEDYQKSKGTFSTNKRQPSERPVVSGNLGIHGIWSEMGPYGSMWADIKTGRSHMA